MLLPHESTVAHEQRFIMDEPMISRTRSRTALSGHLSVAAAAAAALAASTAATASMCGDAALADELRDLHVHTYIFLYLFFFYFHYYFHIQLQGKGSSSVPHTRPETPRSVTHNHDEDCSDDESDPNNKTAVGDYEEEQEKE